MITVLYTCAACGINDRQVIVPERNPDDDVVHYVRDIVGGCISDDHALKSPQCSSRAMTNVKIPVDPSGNLPVGSKIINKPVDDGK